MRLIGSGAAGPFKESQLESEFVRAWPTFPRIIEVMAGPEGRLLPKHRIWIGVAVMIGMGMTLIAVFPDVVPLGLPRLRLSAPDFSVLRHRFLRIALVNAVGDSQTFPEEVGTSKGFVRFPKHVTFFFTIPKATMWLRRR